MVDPRTLMKLYRSQHSRRLGQENQEIEASLGYKSALKDGKLVPYHKFYCALAMMNFLAVPTEHHYS